METLEKTLKTKIKVLKEEPCEITFSVEIAKEEIQQENSKVLSDIQKRASLPGFRVGKAPMDLVEKNFSQRAKQTVLENLVSQAATQTLRDRKLRSIDTPRVGKIDFEVGKPLSFEMTVEKDPEIKAKDYKGIKVNRKEPKVTPELTKKTLEELRDRNASLVTSSAETIGKAHFVVIDFDGKIDGKPFVGGSAKNYLLDMTTPQTIAGFSDGILGAKLNEKRAVSVTFPSDYPRKEWANKAATFDVLIKEIKEKKLPTLDDEFSKDLGFKSLLELEEKIKENHTQEEQARADKEVEEQLHQWLLDHNTFTVPNTLVEERIRALIQRTKNFLARQGLLKADDVESDGALREKVKPQAEKDVRLSYLLRAIADQEKLEATEEDVDVLKKKALEENKEKPNDVEKYFVEHAGTIRASLTEGKVLDFLKKNAKIKSIND